LPISEIHIDGKNIEYKTPPGAWLVGPTRPIVEVRLEPQLGDECVIACFGDLHGANFCHNAELAEATRDYFLEHNIPIISPGTDPEMPLRGSKSESWYTRYPPGKELGEQAKFLSPLAGRADNRHHR